MPVVPRYESSVQESALPGVQLNPNASLEAFGGGQSANAVGNVAQDIVAKYQKQADDIAVNEAYGNSLKAYTDTLHNDVYTLKGKAAIDSTDKVVEGFSKQIDEIGKGLSRSQKAQFYSKQQRLEAGFYSQANRHFFNESQNYAKETYEASETEGLRNVSAVYEEGGIPELIENHRQDSIAHAETMGHGKKWVEQRTSKFASKAYSIVIAGQLNSGEYEEADELYKQVAKSLLPDDREKIKKQIDKADEILNVMEHTSEILKNSATKEQALKMIKEVDPKYQEQVETQVTSQLDKNQKATDEEVESILTNLEELKQGSPDKTIYELVTEGSISMAELQILSEKAPIAIRSFDRDTVPTGSGNMSKWDTLVSMDIKDIASTSRADWLKIIDGLDESQEAIAMSIRVASKENMNKAESLKLKSEIMKQVIEEENIPEKHKNQLHKKINDWYLYYQHENGSPPNENEVREKADALTLEVSVKKEWLPDSKVQVFEMEEKQIENAYIPFNDDSITPELIKSLEKETNDKITNDEIERAAFLKLYGQPAALKQFLKTIRDR